jgi:hypothetical protein
MSNLNSSTQSKDEMGEVKTILCEIRDGILQQDIQALQLASQKLLQKSKPIETLSILASFLFQAQSKASSLSNDEALQVMGYLLQSDTSHYDWFDTAKAIQRTVATWSRSSLEEEEEEQQQQQQHLVVSPQLTHVIVEQVATTPNIPVAECARETMVMMCQILGPSYATTAFHVMVQTWQTTNNENITDKNRNSTMVVRCAQMVTDIAKLDDPFMKAAIDTSAMELFRSALVLHSKDDPLLQISLLDILEQFVKVKPIHMERARWLFQDSVLQPVLEWAGGGTEQDASPDPILGGSALRVLAALCPLAHPHPELYRDTVRSFHRALHNFCNDTEHNPTEIDRLALIDAISSFASSTATALEIVLDDPITAKAWLSLAVAQPKLKSAVLMSVALVFHPAENEMEVDNGTTTNDRNSLQSSWMKLYTALGFHNHGIDTTELLLQLARSPLPETRLSVYALMEAVAKYLNTGGQVLLMNGDFYPFLMNRDLESTFEGRQAKYQVVQAIVQSSAKGLLAEEIVRAMETYISQGPHYVKKVGWEVADQ